MRRLFQQDRADDLRQQIAFYFHSHMLQKPRENNNFFGEAASNHSNFKLILIELEMAKFRRVQFCTISRIGNLLISIGVQEIAGFPVKPLSQKQFGA